MDLTDEEKEIFKRMVDRFLADLQVDPPLTIRERRTLKKVQGYVEKPQIIGQD